MRDACVYNIREQASKTTLSANEYNIIIACTDDNDAGLCVCVSLFFSLFMNIYTHTHTHV